MKIQIPSDKVIHYPSSLIPRHATGSALKSGGSVKSRALGGPPMGCGPWVCIGIGRPSIDHRMAKEQPKSIGPGGSAYYQLYGT